jgi:sec-independent protein translocase protein TatB
VKAEVNRSIELDELKKMRTQFETAAHDMENSVRSEVNNAKDAFEKDWASTTAGLTDSSSSSGGTAGDTLMTPALSYTHPKKNWRLKRGATPQWFKQRSGIRTKAQSGAARVARFRPPGLKTR